MYQAECERTKKKKMISFKKFVMLNIKWYSFKFSLSVIRKYNLSKIIIIVSLFYKEIRVISTTLSKQCSHIHLSQMLREKYFSNT